AQDYFFSSRRRHTRSLRDWSSDVCSSDLYRIYSAWGLNAIDVAKICFLAGLTFWLGNAAVLGLGIAYHPEATAAIDQLPPWFNQIGRASCREGVERAVDGGGEEMKRKEES